MKKNIYLLFLVLIYQVNNVQSQIYIVGGDFDYAPFSYIDKTGKACGLDIDILNAIAAETNLTFNYQLSEWDSALNNIQLGTTDIIIGIVFSEEREKFLDFTYPIHTGDYSIFIHKNLALKKISDLYDYKLIILKEDISIDKFLIPMGLYKNYILAKSLPEALAAIEFGRADYVLAPYSVGMNEIVKNKYKNIEVKGSTIIPSIYCLAVKKGNTQLLGILNKGISGLRTKGELEKIQTKWMVYKRDDFRYKQIAKYIGIVFMITIVLLMLVFVWIWLLRKQIKIKTESLNLKNQELQKNEIQLKELNATKDKLFSIIAHDLRSPFNSMIGITEMLENRFDKYDSEKRKRYIGSINHSLKNIFSLLENLLLWARSQSDGIVFKPKSIKLHLLCKEINELVMQSAKNKSINLTNKIPENTNVYADENMLSMIIRNLISNAIKFTPQNGGISINARPTEDNKYIEIFVKDSGVGISEEIKSTLFDIGESTSTRGTENETGTGLGLILCKEFVEKQGGKIWVESELDKGSVFKFTVPIHKT